MMELSHVRRRRKLEDDPSIQIGALEMPYDVSLILALHFMDDDTALKLEETNGSLVNAFCTVVQEQAGSPQVNSAANEDGWTIVTMDPTSLMECKIQDTVRRYDTGAEILGLHYFTLEVELSQRVYVRSSNETVLSMDSSALNVNYVRSLVENGFNRGRGGRVRFRTLLHGSSNADFDTVLDLDVRSSLSAPQSIPTLSPTGVPPTLSPTTIPLTSTPSSVAAETEAPTVSKMPSFSTQPSVSLLENPMETSFPSVAPLFKTNPPVTARTLSPVMPTASPTKVATPSPTASPSMPRLSFPPDPSSQDAPSALPSHHPTMDNAPPMIVLGAESNGGGSDSSASPLIVAAFVGAGVAIVICCCFIGFLVLKKRRKQNREQQGRDGTNNHNKRRNEENDGLTGAQHSSSLDANDDVYSPRSPATKRHFGSRSSKSSANSTSRTEVPNTVQLDEENRSLANTTLGEHTAGKKPPKKKKKHSMDAAADVSSSLQSFDEESLYTSPSSKRLSSQSLQPSRLIDEGDDQPPRLGLHHVDYEADDDLVFTSEAEATVGESSENEYLLGATGPGSPLAAKIERLIDQELGVEEDVMESDDDSDVVLGEAESPVSGMFDQADQSRTRTSSVGGVPKREEHDLFVLERSEDRASTISKEEAEAALVVAAAASVSGSESSNSRPASPSDSRSSLTEKIGNLLTVTPKMDPQDTSSHLDMIHPPRSSPDAPGKYARSESAHGFWSPASTSPSQSRSFSPTLLESIHDGTEDSQYDDGVYLTAAEPSLNKGFANDANITAFRSRPLGLSHASKAARFVPLLTEASAAPFSDRLIVQTSGIPDSPNMSSSKSDQEFPGEVIEVTPANTLLGAIPMVTPLAAKSSQDDGRDDKEEVMFMSPSSQAEEDDPPRQDDPDEAEDTTDDESNNFLFSAIAGMLGPRSMSADLESLGGRSTKSARSARSVKSHKSLRSTKSDRTGRSSNMPIRQIPAEPQEKRLGISTSIVQSASVSLGSRVVSFAEDDDDDEVKSASTNGELPKPRSLEYDLQRLELQLQEMAAKKAAIVVSPEAEVELAAATGAAAAAESNRPLSPLSVPSPQGSVASRSARSARSDGRPSIPLGPTSTTSSFHSRVSHKQRVVVVAPPGKLGVILANRHKGGGTVVSEVRANSALAGSLVPGDKLVAIDGVDVSSMIVKEITAIMQSRKHKERHLTVITTTELRSRSSQTPAQVIDRGLQTTTSLTGEIKMASP